MKVYYIRVSTTNQSTERQEIEVKEKDAKVFIEKISGKDTNRPQLKAMLDFVREGDVVEVESYSRLARSTKDLLNIIELLENKGVSFVSRRENIDTSTASGRLMLTIFAGLAQFERELLLERQKAGVELAKIAGKYKGRKPKAIDLEAFKSECGKWRAGEQTAVKTMKQLDLKANYFYRKVKELAL